MLSLDEAGWRSSLVRHIISGQKQREQRLDGTKGILLGDKEMAISMQNPIALGIIGGGQLGKMIAQEAKRMSLKVIILDPAYDCPASFVSDEIIVADFKDEAAIRKLATMSDIVTYEIELANSNALKDLEAEKYPVYPSPETLRLIQNKYRQKSFLKDHNISVAKFELVKSQPQLEQLCEEYGFPAMLKASENSYDGRGNFLITSKDNIRHGLLTFQGKECMLEEFIPFVKEISVMTARNPSGQIESFPVTENIHFNNILDMTIAPARIPDKVLAKAQVVAQKTLGALKGAGIFGIEMFVLPDEDVVINEIAPRPHNSGHYSIEACSISQFEQHIRAVLDLPLSKPRLLSPAVMLNLLGPENGSGPYKILGLKELFSIPGLKLHVYGKKISKPRRKLGHITITSQTVEDAISKAERARNVVKIVLDC
jgi:5-(carboxyamino)imidazole ribonucleotide synthase